MKNFLKLWFTCVLLVTMTTVSVFAAGSVNCAVKAVPVGDALQYEVVVRGTAKAGTAVSLEILDSSGAAVLLEQMKADETGNFSLPIVMTASGDYSVYINDYAENTPQSTTFSLLSLSYYEGVALSLNEAEDKTAVLTVLGTESTKLGLDLRYFTASVQDAVADEMLRLKGSFTAFNIAELFDESVIRAYLCNEANRSKADEIISYYDSYLNIKGQTTPKSMFSDYLEFPQNVKNIILADAFATLTDLSDAAENFHFAAAKNAIKELSNTDADKFITAHLDYYEFDGYQDLATQTLKKAKLLNALREKNLGSNKAELKGVYAQTLNELDEPTDGAGSNNTQGTGGTGTGGIGGGGFGGGSGIGSNGVTSGNVNIYETESLPVPQQPTEQTEAASFLDLGDVEWAREAILALAQKGIVNGKGGNSFAPNDPITREEYAKILSLAFAFYDAEAEATFTDVDESHWAYRYIASTQKQGYITGYPDGGFHGGEAISRQDMAVILYRILAKTKAIPLQEQLYNPFADYAEISEYAQNAVLMLYNAEIINGVTEDTFEPNREATRAEICVMLYRVLNRING